MVVEWKVALPLHPEYRTLPMVWYIPPLSPIQEAVDSSKLGKNGIFPEVDDLSIPVRYLANLLTGGNEEPVVRSLKKILAMRVYMRDKLVNDFINFDVLKENDLTEDSVEEMYRYMAIANYEDRFVIPTSRADKFGQAFAYRSGVGFGSSECKSEKTNTIASNNLFGGV